MTPHPRGLTVHLEGVLPAPAALVFSALTDPPELAKWWGPDGFTTPRLELDLRVGGRYRIAMQPPEGDLFHLQGEFREVDPPRRLAYTFRWEDPDPDDAETIVTLSLRDLGRSTELTLDQGVFATEPRRALHERGWTDAFEKLRDLTSGLEFR
ncbi:MAG: SRPBCC domain-containing protein [Actinomycetota bacterium]|nr:SRPBCC domain-containing protein [Actinomycetota bacterium]